MVLKEILQITDGNIVRGEGDALIKKAVTRFNRLTHNALYFDLRGNTTIHLGRVNCVIVTSRPEKFICSNKGITIVKVPDVTAAYWAFVRYYRNLFEIPVIGVTGTCGKTTTKEMIKHILEARYNVKATYRSLNGACYHLRYLTDFDETTEVGVIEMGVAYPGDLLNCCKHFKPGIGIITTIGVDHLKGCKSLSGYIQAKAEILEGLAYSGTLILNTDDENIRKINLTPFKGRILYFGLNNDADFRASSIRYSGNGMKFTLEHQDRRYRLVVPGFGKHNVYNALAAIAAVHTLGFDIYEAGKLLASFEHVEKHIQIRRGINRCFVMDDTWSTNPTSFEAALEVLKDVYGAKKIAVLGHMEELGDHTDNYHAQAGEKIAEMKIDMLVTVGTTAKKIARSALDKGMPTEKVISCNTPDEVFDIISPYLNRRTMVFLKKSMNVSFNALLTKLIKE